MNKQTKPKLVESLMIVIIALQLAYSYKKKQSDTILKSMDQIMKQTELTRTCIKNKKTESPNESSSKNFSYAEAVQLSPIVLKPLSSQTLSKVQTNGKMSQALDEIKVAYAKVTENGKILVNVPNKVN